MELYSVEEMSIKYIVYSEQAVLYIYYFSIFTLRRSINFKFIYYIKCLRAKQNTAVSEVIIPLSIINLAISI